MKFEIIPPMDPNVAITRIFLALILGAIIGLEREFTQKSAGLRTHILVTMGATVFTLVSLSDFYHGLHGMPFILGDDNRIVRDPSRVAAQIVTGIGFIGGGAVLRHGVTIRGLTTAASLWSMASIGMLVGIGQYRLSVIATLLIFLVLFTIGKVERHFFTKSIRTFNRLRVHFAAHSQDMPAIQNWIEEHYKGKVAEIRTRSDPHSDKIDANYTLNVAPGEADVAEASRQISSMQGVISCTVKSCFENEDGS